MNRRTTGASESRQVGAPLIRELEDGDLQSLYDFHHDEASIRMAAVLPRDRAAFAAHWDRLRSDGSTLIRVVASRGHVAGYAFTFERAGVRELGYWIGRAFWGAGLATAVARALVQLDPIRPLYGVVAAHNLASRRVLEKCGFVLVGTVDGLPVVAGQGGMGYKLRLDSPAPP